MAILALLFCQGLACLGIATFDCSLRDCDCKQAGKQQGQAKEFKRFQDNFHGRASSRVIGSELDLLRKIFSRKSVAEESLPRRQITVLRPGHDGSSIVFGSTSKYGSKFHDSNKSAHFFQSARPRLKPLQVFFESAVSGAY